ncbi:MAG: tetratricopeptide repeat protein, partial [Acetobacteraceae bacterium]|nr:tetratricopeptide repeat protein [Acetobacteraceae bacterium]
MYETRINTDGLDEPEMPQTVSFNTVVDRPSQQQPFDPRATQVSSSNPFQPNESAPTSLLSAQPTANLSATIANNPYDDLPERGTQNITAANTGFAPTEVAPPARPTAPPPQASQPLPPPAPPDFSAPLPPPAQARNVTVPPAPLRPLPASGGGTALPPGGVVAPPRRGGLRGWHVGLGALALLLILGALAGAFFVARKYLPRAEAQPTPTPVVATAQPGQKSAADLFGEADTMLASGDIAGALGKLREAVALDPANAEAQRRLGDALMRNGSRAEAIDAYRAAAAANPQDAALWRTLASTQLDEGQYTESVDSFRQYIALSGAAAGDDVQMSLADALRNAGRAEEAKAAYQKLISSPNQEIAQAARQHLTELGKPQSQLTPMAEATRVAARNKANQSLTPQPTVTAASTVAVSRPTPVVTAPPAEPTQAPQAQTPADHYRRGVELWGSNRAAAVRE